MVSTFEKVSIPFISMVFSRRRRITPRYGRRPIRRRRTLTRRYARRPTTRVRQRRLPRTSYSRSRVRFTTKVARTLRSIAETKIVPWREIEFSQPAPCATAVGVSQVKFISGQTSVPGYPDFTPVGGFLIPQGDGKNARDGQFVYLKGSTLNLTIQADHSTLVGRPAPIHFRVIVFKTKRALSPMGETLASNTDLFLRNDGGDTGDARSAPFNMNNVDVMLQPVNKNNFFVIMDRKFKLGHTQTTAYNNDPDNIVVVPPQQLQRYIGSYKNFRINLQHSKKTRYELDGNEPINYNYRFCIAIYAYFPNQAPDTPADTPEGWSASIRGTTTFLDL